MNATKTLLSKFERFLALSEAERQAINSLPIQVERIEADQAILREGTRPRRSTLLVEGLACNSKVGTNGKRQILAFHIPEDAPDLTSLHLQVRDSDNWALTDCTVAYLTHHDLQQFCDKHPKLASFLWRATLVDASIHREWTMNVGLRDGLSRMAHLFCEMMTRMETIGRSQDRICAFPVTQGDLGEATGMSIVHVNRLLQELRRQELISFSGGKLAIHYWDSMVELGDFRTAYLHLPPTVAA